MISISLSPAAQTIVAALRSLPARLAAAMAGAMDLENQFTITHISQRRMRGNNNRPFPPELGILGIRSGRLVSSLRASPAKVEGNQITSTIGTNVVYAGVHEFGATLTRTSRPGEVRLRTDARGELLRQGPGGRLAIFARARHRRVRTVAYAGGRVYDIHIPARAPITRGIEDRVPNYSAALSEAIEATPPFA